MNLFNILTLKCIEQYFKNIILKECLIQLKVIFVGLI